MLKLQTIFVGGTRIEFVAINMNKEWNMTDQYGSADGTLDLIEAAHYLRLGINATRQLFDSGAIPGTSLNQKHIVFLRGDLAAYLHRTGHSQASARRAGIGPAPTSETRKCRGRKKRPLPDLDRYVNAS